MAALGQATHEELLLYRVLQRANLTQYYETFIQQGGDDVRQLCEAGEEEFLEIMALVGMAAKPLHVRRLQKALQEWITQPDMFEKPIGPHTPPPQIATGSIVATVGRPAHKSQATPPLTANSNGNHTIVNSNGNHTIVRSSTPTRSDSNPTPPQGWISNPDSRSSSPNPAAVPITIEPIMSSPARSSVADMTGHSLNTALSTLPAFISEPAPMWKAPILMANGTNGLLDFPRGNGSTMSSSGSDSNLFLLATNGGVSQMEIPTLTEQQQLAIEAACERLTQELPNYEPKHLNTKNKVNKEIMELMNMADDHPEKIVLLRKYSAIYARFDSKRKNDTKMSLHEVSVNEASAQLCKRIPALLTRREDLYPLARRAVRDSGYRYSKGHSSKNIAKCWANTSMEIPPNKKIKIEKVASYVPSLHETRINEITKEIEDILKHQEEIKVKMSEARSKNDVILLELLRHELEKCANQQLQLRMEQSSIVGSGRNKALQNIRNKPESSARNNTEEGKSQSPAVLDLSSAVNQDSDTEVVLVQDSPNGTDIVHSDNSQHSTDRPSLLEQSLTGQRYRVPDLENHMTYYQDDDIYDDSEIDEQEEWNREVERDLEKLKQTPPKSTTNPTALIHSSPSSQSESNKTDLKKEQVCDSTSVSMESGKEVPALNLVTTSSGEA